jgi:transposase-like protein
VHSRDYRRHARGQEGVDRFPDGLPGKHSISGSELLADLKSRGLAVPPELATGDGALGFWKALEEEFGATRQQRCWVHKTANVLNKMPKSVQPKAKADLKEIWQAEANLYGERSE